MLITLMSLAVVSLVLLERGWLPTVTQDTRVDQRKSREQLRADLDDLKAVEIKTESDGLKAAAARVRAMPRITDTENNVLAIEVSAGGKVIVKVYQRDGEHFCIQASSDCACCHEELLSYLKLAQNLISSPKCSLPDEDFCVRHSIPAELIDTI